MQPRFAWLDEPVKSEESLPAWHCSECGGSGWMSMIDEKQDTVLEAKGVPGHALVKDPTAIYTGWFRPKVGHDHRCLLIAPWHPRMDAGKQLELGTEHDYLCEKSLVLRKADGPCPLTGDDRRFRVVVNRDRVKHENGAKVGDQKCPCCGSSEGVFLIGSQAATLSSVAIDEMFGSALNRDPKLLAFTDSVQDASHRAGFFTARTYRFTFRTALQHTIDECGAEGLPLVEAGRRVLEWASEQKQGRPGNPCDALAVLMPADLQEYKAYREFRAAYKPGAAAPPKLWNEISERLTWEATSEFGLMVTHGRTLEQSAASCLAWKDEVVEATLANLAERLERISPKLACIDRDLWQLWLYGLLHRYRLRGAVEHPFLLDYARKSFWGKYPFGRTIPGRETFPASGKYKPRLLVTKGQKGQDHILAGRGGSILPWHLVWTRRVLPVAGMEDATLLDILRAFLVAGEKGGVLVRLADTGDRQHYALSAEAAFLTSETRCLECSGSNRLVIRPTAEADLWNNAPSMEYYEEQGRYRFTSLSRRQEYYQNRYHKGALRRVTAAEHTGLLATEEREQLEKDFGASKRADDPNVLTCTSTLEMGINIGDLSSTMLCSIPPSTASYLQRIGRAGRATGTALIISVINQRPHDLFFYARPGEMLKGRVLPPGCWLDATAVLARQYLAFCFDRGTHLGLLKELPRTAGQLLDDLNKSNGQIPGLFTWVSENEADLQGRFLARFSADDRVGWDTRKRFINETGTERLLGRIRSAVQEFERLQRELLNSRRRLQSELINIGEDEAEARQEITQELKLLKGRASELSRTTSLELLTDHGLLPNYAFPERGVRFHGGVYNKHGNREQEPFSVKVVRPAGAALRELAPSNTFYTHRRQFKIQQLAIGTKQDRLPEKWCICGRCGHMRRLEELRRERVAPFCPQCSYEGTVEAQVDQQQQRDFLEFARSESLSFMEHYDSLSADRSDERERLQYALVKSFDQTVEAPVGAIVDEELPFGIEYRAAMVLREVNGGYGDRPRVIPFGKDQAAPEEGFFVCSDCGVVVAHGVSPEKVDHRRHCTRRRENDRRLQKELQPLAYRWERLYLYRELKSEAIRLLLPTLTEEEQETLTACLYLGLRMRFEGNPGHLIISPQVIPEATRDVDRQHLVLMDSVPGGTGYLKSLYQEKDADGRDGEGLVKVLRLAHRGLVECECGRLHNLINTDDPDGCYRCIRSYHLQYHSEKISRIRGIRLLERLIASAERRRPEKALDDIKAVALFESTLERKFIAHLAEWVREQGGSWESTSVRGKQGYRFRLPAALGSWEIELQSAIGLGDGIGIASRPDFMFRSDSPDQKPIAVFTDGFEFHCHPTNRLADDIGKRRALVESGDYWVWAISWKDILGGAGEQIHFLGEELAQLVERYGVQSVRWKGKGMTGFQPIHQNGFDQLKAFLINPADNYWADLANFASHFPLIQDARKVIGRGTLERTLAAWLSEGVWRPPDPEVDGQWVVRGGVELSPFVELVTYTESQNATGFDAMSETHLFLRLETSGVAVASPGFEARWRAHLAAMNFFQFHSGIVFLHGTDPNELNGLQASISENESLSAGWADAAQSAVSIAAQLLRRLGRIGVTNNWPAPTVEFEESEVTAELAWPDPSLRLVVLVDDQAYFASKWIDAGWKVLELREGRLPGDRELEELFRETARN